MNAAAGTTPLALHEACHSSFFRDRDPKGLLGRIKTAGTSSLSTGGNLVVLAVGPWRLRHGLNVEAGPLLLSQDLQTGNKGLRLSAMGMAKDKPHSGAKQNNMDKYTQPWGLAVATTGSDQGDSVPDNTVLLAAVTEFRDMFDAKSGGDKYGD
ncbi:hypothetical protein NDU88_006412 [Pleurodeles waltl]|uniref:Uncharacterized protein n=1 Tax=Pleurodeles waltl TaxID=8319 RepID=A0AAV7SPS3_PLEWA|nr:hypothetical protein NDU88_006412 [Pleurodeles waltl]